jgi:hypothetical protein
LGMRFAALAALLLCFTPSLSATVLLPADFRQIVAGSQIIVYGRVTDVRAEWASGRRRIESVVTVAASEFYKGTPSRTVTLRVPGGTIGRYKSVTVGAPEFRVGDEAVLFLKAEAPAVPHIFGLNQGVFRVRIDSRSGRRIVTVPILSARGTTPEIVQRGATHRRPLPLAQFVSQVRSAVQQGGVR